MFCYIVVVATGKTITDVKKEKSCKERSRVLNIPSLNASNTTATSNARYTDGLNQTSLNATKLVGVKPHTKIF
jgi:hypothetical protein